MRQTWAEQAVVVTREALFGVADVQRAPAMAAYMRSKFPFLGVAAPARRAMTRSAWRSLRPPEEGELLDAAAALWREAHREFQYSACDLLARNAHLLSASALEPLSELIVSKSWWDSVDALRPAAIGPLVARHRELAQVLSGWIDNENMWLVRSAIIHQLGYGPETDQGLLFDFCARRADEQEFFIAKAIGWALRTHAGGSPEAVRAFVAAHPELSPLARREALRRIGPKAER